MKRPEKQVKIPILYYEEAKPGEPVNPIPYIEVAKEDSMPKILFIQEYKETGEVEVDEVNGGSCPIVDMYMHKFVDLEHLMKVLTPSQFDKVRMALGMLPLKVARKRGEKILNQVVTNANNNRQILIDNQEKRSERAFVLGEDLRVKSENYLKSTAENEEEKASTEE